MAKDRLGRTASTLIGANVRSHAHMGAKGGIVRGLLRHLVVRLFIASSLVGGIAVPAAPAAAAPDAIGVCCAWGEGIKDGITYSIKAPEELAGPIRDAVEAWEAATGLPLNEAGPLTDKRAIEVSISYKRGGGVVAGQTLRKFEPRTAFVKGATVQISGGAFGNAYDVTTIAKIALHEFGHVLGADHADAPGYVMSSTVDAMADSITACDKAAVEAAQKWFLDSPGGPPTPPSVSC
jgi:hypothetical protein